MLLNELVFELMQKTESGRAFQSFPPQECRVARQRFFEHEVPKHMICGIALAILNMERTPWTMAGQSSFP